MEEDFPVAHSNRETRGSLESPHAAQQRRNAAFHRMGAKVPLQAVISSQQNTSCHMALQLEEEMAV